MAEPHLRLAFDHELAVLIDLPRPKRTRHRAWTDVELRRAVERLPIDEYTALAAWWDRRRTSEAREA